MRSAVALGGDGLIGAVADALKHSDGVVGVLPGGRGNDFARVLGIPLEPARRVRCARLGRGARARPRRGRVDDVHRHRQLRVRLGGQPDRERDAGRARQPRLRVRRDPRAARLEAGAVRGQARRRRATRAHRLHGRGRQLQGLRWRDVPGAGRLARGRPARRRARRRRPEAPLPAAAADGVQGRARATSRTSRSCAPGRSRSAPTGRSRCTPTAIRSPSCRSPSARCRRRCG